MLLYVKKSVMNKIINIIFLLWAPLHIMAQNNTIQGKLIDLQTGAPISGASIFYQQQHAASSPTSIE